VVDEVLAGAGGGDQGGEADVVDGAGLAAGVCYAKTLFMSAELAFRALGCSAVLADQTAEDLSALDPGSDIDGNAGLALRGFLLQALARTVAVVVPGVLGL
jgi:hypothetical protein